MLKIGDPAPDFSLPTDAGGVFTLGAQQGRTAVLVFYNQDDTDNCTRETQEFSALLADFVAADAVVAGISPDSIESHCAFRDKYGLALPLLADPDRRAIEAYGVWGRKKLYGREYDGLIRTTFVIGADGRIAEIFPVRRINGHAGKVLEAVRALKA